MSNKLLLGGVAALALLTTPLMTQSAGWIVGTAQAQSAAISVGVFYDELTSEGAWVKHSKYRYVWIPTKVAADWTPYTHGRWVYTERYGWYFASDEPFAWAVYHYGRWAFEPQLGWYWVPGRVWAPAWVSWRRSNDYVGWAPLPPEGDGLSVSVSISTYEPPRSHWHFVPVRKFASRDLSVVVVNDNSVYEHTEYYGPVTIENNIVINNVININFVRDNSDEEVEVVEAKVVNDPRDAKTADGSAVVAVEGQVGEPSSTEAPPEGKEPTEVKSPTAEQKVEATADGGSTETPADEASDAPSDTSGEGQKPQAEPTEENPATATDAAKPAEESSDSATDKPAEATEGSQPTDQAPAEGETSDTTEGSDSTQPVDPAPSEAETTKPAEAAKPAEEAPDAGEAAGQAPAATAPTEQPADQAPETGEATDQAPAEVPAEPDASAAKEQQPKADQCSEEDKAAGRC
ncbi:DUF6600 domain-containing protein [Mesorhizobium sp. 10J20-29]